jgi:chemotaxis protein methyltransferase CheR
MPVSPASFDWVRRLVEERTGNLLEDQKSYLVETRLAPIVASEGLSSVDELANALRTRPRLELERQCVEAILTHESSFFRDPHYFEELASRLLPELIARRQSVRRLTIWCAACASGQEPYSLAMVIREQFGSLLNDWHLDFVASDLARPVIEQARGGHFSQVEIQRGLSPQRLARFFRQVNDRWVIESSLRDMIRFREVNLYTDDPPLQNIDLVLLRNVLIYMNEPTRILVLQRVQRALAPDGCLVLGATETPYGLDVGLDRNAGRVPTYRRSNQNHRQSRGYEEGP